MDINAILRALTMRNAQANKAHLNGVAKVEIVYHQGNPVKAFYEERSSLIPGEDPKTMPTDGQKSHGG